MPLRLSFAGMADVDGAAQLTRAIGDVAAFEDFRRTSFWYFPADPDFRRRSIRLPSGRHNVSNDNILQTLARLLDRGFRLQESELIGLSIGRFVEALLRRASSTRFRQ